MYLVWDKYNNFLKNFNNYKYNNISKNNNNLKANNEEMLNNKFNKRKNINSKINKRNNSCENYNNSIRVKSNNYINCNYKDDNYINLEDETDRSKLNTLKLNCKKLDNIGNLKIYLYPKIEISEGEKNKTINFMVVGQTGSGKTTLLNAFLNYLLGVKYEDNFRFKLIHEDFGISKALSQTRDVNLYYIRPLINNYPVITVIDTPGFGDTGGIEKDKLISDKIAEKFRTSITHINAICFVAQSTNSKLTVNQKYIFNSIMDLFSEDIKENFIAMLTFCNIIDDKPVILEPLKRKGSGFDLVLPAIEKTQWHFLFDNLAIFKSKENSKMNNKIKVFYGFAMENFDDFMKKLITLPKKRLTNTKKVLEDRKFLESRIQVLEEILKYCLNEIDKFMQLYEQIRNYYDELKNKNFIYTVNEIKSRKVPISEYKNKFNRKGGKFFTTCLICSHTCHPLCYRV